MLAKEFSTAKTNRQMKINKSVLFALLFAAFVIYCLSSCSFDRSLYVKEVVVKVIKIDTVYRYNAYNETVPLAIVTVIDANGTEFEINPPKPLPCNDWIGETKVIYLKW